MIPVYSACGSNVTRMKAKDADMNPWGYICCPSCRTIIESREAWMDSNYEMLV